MKRCLVCFHDSAPDEATCPHCGEASWAPHSDDDTRATAPTAEPPIADEKGEPIETFDDEHTPVPAARKSRAPKKG